MAQNKVLVIDDDPEVQDLLTIFLQLQGYEKHLASNGEEGIRLAKKVLPQLILLDIMMPSVDGFSVQQALKEDPKTRDIPIIFITAKAEPENAQKVIAAGARAYIEKPFDLDMLSETIRSVLGSR